MSRPRWRTTPLVKARPVEPSRNGSRASRYSDEIAGADAGLVSTSIDELTREVKLGLKMIAEAIDEQTTILESYLDEWEKERVS